MKRQWKHQLISRSVAIDNQSINQFPFIGSISWLTKLHSRFRIKGVHKIFKKVVAVTTIVHSFIMPMPNSNPMHSPTQLVNTKQQQDIRSSRAKLGKQRCRKVIRVRWGWKKTTLARQRQMMLGRMMTDGYGSWKKRPTAGGVATLYILKGREPEALSKIRSVK